MNQKANKTKINENIWIADSGESFHMSNSLGGMIDLNEKKRYL